MLSPLRCGILSAAFSILVRSGVADIALDDLREPFKATVLIIGGGMAGVAAAKTLADQNVTDFLIIEARDYLGGRVHAEPFTSGFGQQHIVEFGANWIHGVSDQQFNPIHRLAEAAGLVKTVIPGSCANLSGYTLYHEDGTVVEDAEARIERFMKAVDCANATASQGGPDMTLSMALAHCDFSVHDAIDTALIWEVGAANNMLDPSAQSLNWMFPDETYARLGPDDFFVHDQRDRGYAAVVDQLLADAGVDGKSDKRVVLNSEVSKIRVNAKHVDVVTADGRVFRGRIAISTLPLAVMQAMQASIFEPALPAEQVRALNSFTMGNFTKIFAMFPEQFWADRGTQWIAADNQDMPLGMPQEFHDIGSLVPGFHTLFTYVVGDDSPKWEAMSDETAAVMLVNRLMRVFPGKTIPYPSAFKMTRHGSDPFMRGAYTTVMVGVPFDDVDVMNTPVQGKVFFGGEHSCARYQGFLHGAFSSGVRAAGQALQEMGIHTGMSDPCGSGYGMRSAVELVV